MWRPESHMVIPRNAVWLHKAFLSSLRMVQPSKRQTLQNEGLAHVRKLSSKRKCVRNQPLVDKDKILLLPLHIILGLSLL